jgi:hypothetical protein
MPRKPNHYKMGHAVRTQDATILPSAIDSLLESKSDLPWQRYWCRSPGKFELDHQGFLADPATKSWYQTNRELKTLEEVESTCCLALLGEPGAGKSNVLFHAAEALKTRVSQDGDQVRFVDLNAYNTDVALIEDVFENEQLRKWQHGIHTLHLFLDSLDECQLRMDNVGNVLGKRLKQWAPHAARLRLRIGCRTAAWPQTLQDSLRDVWKSDEIGVYELAPLRKLDVDAALKTYDIDPNDFFGELAQKQAAPFAIKPVTLRFLLESFRRNKHLPASKSDLYLEGCRILSEESNQSRRDALQIGRLSQDQRLAVACRLAAVTILCNRSHIFRGSGGNFDSSTDVSTGQLCGGTEPVGPDQLPVDEHAVREVLDTGLFTSRGTDRFGWAHQTYPEFLAARFVVIHKMPIEQVRTLFFHSEQNRLIPQLEETSAWLANLSAEVRAELIKTDPEALLDADPFLISNDIREQIAKALLARCARQELWIGWNKYPLLARMAHPGLAVQLWAVIENRDEIENVRLFAIRWATVCRVKELALPLAHIALDQSYNRQIRIAAAHAVVYSGNDAARASLRPLAEGSAGDDPDDELKGCGLRALWPEHISAHQLFELLTPQRNPNQHGAYSEFLRTDLVVRLKPADLPTALCWASKQPQRHDFADCMRRLVDQVIACAWEHVTEPTILQPFATVALRRFAEYARFARKIDAFQEEPLWEPGDEQRLVLAAELVPRFALDGLDPKSLLFASPPLLHVDDLAWLIARLRAETTPKQRPTWAALICRLGFSSAIKPHHIDLLIDAIAEIPELKAQMGEAFEPWPLDSERAVNARKSNAEYKRNRPADPPPLDPPPKARVQDLLNRCEKGEPNLWWAVARELTLTPHSTYYDGTTKTDITAYPGWLEADPATRSRIVRAAQQYLIATNAEHGYHIDSGAINISVALGYHAFLLLSREDPPTFNGLSADIWSKWILVLLAYPSFGTPNKDEDAITAGAYRNAPEPFLKAAVALTLDAAHRAQPAFVLTKIRTCWDERTTAALEPLLTSAEVDGQAFRELLIQLIVHDSLKARKLAKSLLSPDLSGIEQTSERALHAAFVLAVCTPDAGWDAIWPAMQRNPEWGEQLVRLLSDTYESPGNIAGKLTTVHAAEFFAWMEGRFPHTGDPEISRDGKISTTQAIAHFRDGVLSELISRGTSQACEQIEKLISRFPTRSQLPLNLVHAQTLMRQNTWTPPTPDSLLRLSRDCGLRLVESGAQLLDVLIESLKRWERKLQGTPPAAFRVWDGNRPKAEEKISDDVVIHLTEDLHQRGVVANREVTIRKGEKPGGIGERTDIVVNAVRRDPISGSLDMVGAIIETKGCWNRDLQTAMKDQLVDRYLRDNKCQHGLYLVGWFVCPQWDCGDARRRHVPNLTIDRTKAFFDEQARSYSTSPITIRAFVANCALR